MYDINTNITAAPRTKGESVSNRRARKEEAKRVISLLAERSPAAFVAPDQAEHARAVVAQMEAKAVAEAEEARRATNRTTKQPSPPPPAPSLSDGTAPRRLGLADLKRAAVERRNGGAS
jgi:hypothetical protein